MTRPSPSASSQPHHVAHTTLLPQKQLELGVANYSTYELVMLEGLAEAMPRSPQTRYLQWLFGNQRDRLARALARTLEEFLDDSTSK